MNRFTLRLIPLVFIPLFSVACFYPFSGVGTTQLDFTVVLEKTNTSYSGGSPKLLVIHSEQDWNTVWENEISGLIIPKQPAPEIDFSSQVLFAVFLGQRSTGGHSIQVTNITANTFGPSADVLITADTSGPKKNEIVTLAFTSPVQVVSVARENNFSVEDAWLQIGTSNTFIPAESL